MSKYTYKEILETSKKIQKTVKKEYKLGVSSKWGYYIAKAIINPKKDINRINFEEAKKPQETNISRQLTKGQYTTLCKNLITYVEKHKIMPNYIEFKEYKIKPRVFTEVLSRILIFYEVEGRLPEEVNITSKVFTKPTENSNVVYDYWVKKFKFSPKTMDEILAYVQKYFSYQHYFDDHKSNKEVIDTKSGNCTDLLQMLVNMLKKLGYECTVIHVKCKGGDGHVRLKTRHKKNTENTWVYRDIACVANGGSITCNWCMNGTLLANNPSWFMENLNR